ncbi:uncharacterized protein TRUGW13939_11607 [Talaromyces rugulosus]|uniref:Zn(2)-C6 fungal-type domain-containing protein n=1 Tax=Talaromyces rugulosus TaxID=121627 RepID=A0A7H8RIJ6_TALRU|nr:uncharacterized protein TRUGW13939_11607 [Talaromyces rugulosus]QKX64433.1 hypothetical protein TRUGW13939_11607 [Talaromyces rugulosus]
MPPAAGSSPKKRQIPGTSVLQWQSPEIHTSRRRPMTACKTCRLAKAKCNGQQSCERCRTRGIRCTYSRASSGAARNRNSKSKSPASQTPTGESPSNGQGIVVTGATSDPMSVDVPGDVFPMSDHAGSTGQSTTTNPMDHWREETFQQALEEFNWVFPEPDFSLNLSDDPDRNGLELFPPVRPENSDLPEPPPETAGSSSQTQTQLTLHNCQCRTNMMLQVPKLEIAIQEKQLDTMFKVTGDVIRSCQESTNCGCHVNPVDLVCIMAVFEQTAACFDYIAKSGFGGTVKVGIGAYCISLTDDASLKRMLVLDLIKQANVLLDSVCALAEDMFMSRSNSGVKVMNRSPACLNQLNRNYVREAAASFKKLFCLMTGVFDGKDCDSS